MVAARLTSVSRPPRSPFALLFKLLPLVSVCALMGGCASIGDVAGGGKASQIIVSVQDQKMTVIREGGGRVSYPISTSKFGLDGRRRSYTTPTGNLAVAQKVGDGAPVGAVFHGRIRTGEVVKVDSPGRDPIVTRILVLRGLDAGNSDAASRGIYIHGTPQESLIGQRASYGCIRMRSRDVIALYDMVGVGTRVRVLDSTQRGAMLASGVDLNARPPAEVTAPVSTGQPVVPTAGTTGETTVAAAGTTPTNATVPKPAATVATTTVPPAAATAVVVAPTTTTAARTAAASKPAAVQVVANTAGSGGKWAGSPGNLLAQRPVTAAATPVPIRREILSVRAPANGAHPVANTTTEATDASRYLKRSALDSL